ncbi:hypothetical protein Aperf_G00000096304 [Anoplocephala perfoliata]
MVSSHFCSDLLIHDKLESPIHGISETIPIDRRERVFKEHLRWFLHSRWCVRVTRRKICNGPRCQQLRPVVDHIKTCKDSSVYDMPYRAVTKECLAHFDSCEDADCHKCKPMKSAFFCHFLSDVEKHPQPAPDFLPKNELSKRILQMRFAVALIKCILVSKFSIEIRLH